MADEACVSFHSFILHLQLLQFRATSALSFLAGVEVTGTGPSRSTREGHSGVTWDFSVHRAYPDAVVMVVLSEKRT